MCKGNTVLNWKSVILADEYKHHYRLYNMRSFIITSHKCVEDIEGIPKLKFMLKQSIETATYEI